MLELAPTGCGNSYQRAFAGDSFNTAVYLARAAIPTTYLTRLGDDKASAEALQFMQAEGIDSSLIEIAEGCNIGLYLIDNDDSGERTFTYYRDSSPARRLFDEPRALTASVLGADVFYFTGITLAVTRSGRKNLLRLLAALKETGCQIIFDPNYRPRLWDDVAQARSCCLAVLRHCDLILPTQEDDLALWAIGDADQSIDFYRQLGASEVVVKGAERTVQAWTSSGRATRKAEAIAAVDTTGAGDAFNAGYLASRLAGVNLEPSLAAAQQLAARVVQHHGAILPRQESPPGENTGER
jgi:2-dehydro-3-deoxygluconokinase